MPDRPYTRSGRRALSDYFEFQNQSGEYVVSCLNRGVLGLARVLLETRALWPTTYSVAWYDDGYDIPNSQQMELVEAKIAEFLEDTNDMNCNDFLAELARIADAAERSARANEQCCGPGSGGAGGSEQPESPFTDDGSTNYPAGYANRSEYETNKCQGAKAIIEQLKVDLLYIRNGSIVTLVATGLVAALISPIPFSRVAALSGFAIALVAQGVLVSTAQEVLDYLNNNEQDILCALFNAPTVADAIADFDDGSMGLLASTLLFYMLSPDNLNRLFEYDLVGDYGASCAACTCEWIVDYGSGTPTTDNVPFVITSALSSPGVHTAGIQLLPNCCGPAYRVHVVNVSFGGSGNGCLLENCPNLTDLCTGGKLVVGSYDNIGGQVAQTKTTTSPFTITLRIEVM